MRIFLRFSSLSFDKLSAHNYSIVNWGSNKINTILWFDVIPESGYAPIIIFLLKSILKRYSCDIVMFNTGYDALIVRKRGEITLGETDIPLVMDIDRAIKEDDP